jgi:hypothetical protein
MALRCLIFVLALTLVPALLSAHPAGGRGEETGRLHAPALLARSMPASVALDTPLEGGRPLPSGGPSEPAGGQGMERFVQVRERQPAEAPSDLTCDNVRCPSGTSCVMQAVQCVRAPCPPIPVCMPQGR